MKFKTKQEALRDQQLAGVIYSFLALTGALVLWHWGDTGTRYELVISIELLFCSMIAFMKFCYDGIIAEVRFKKQ